MFSLSIIAADKEELYAGNQLRILGLLKGYEDGSLKLDNNIVRGEVAALAVRMLGYEDQNVDGEDKQFSDITKKYWGYNVVQKAYKLKIINGYPDSTFKPTNNISYAEVVAIMVNILGQNKDLEGTWPNNYLNRGKSLGIIPKDSTVPGDKIVTRGEMAVIIWDTLLVKQK
jgi:hypothetical protein